MTDIIERLRADVAWWENQYGLSQAETERLRADLDILKRHYNLHPDAPLSREETIAAKDAEIERLRAALNELTTEITQSSVLMDNISLAKFEDACRALEPKPR